jgi:hypothetical protein
VVGVQEGGTEEVVPVTGVGAAAGA